MVQGANLSFNPLSLMTTPAKAATVESQQAYRILTLSEIDKLLDGKDPFTYVLSRGDEPGAYLLSYVREDFVVINIRFRRDDEKNAWCYTNGQDNEFQALHEMIRGAMHCGQHQEPIPCQF